jgi:hypothetical protein
MFAVLINRINLLVQCFGVQILIFGQISEAELAELPKSLTRQQTVFEHKYVTTILQADK